MTHCRTGPVKKGPALRQLIQLFRHRPEVPLAQDIVDFLDVRAKETHSGDEDASDVTSLMASGAFQERDELQHFQMAQNAAVIHNPNMARDLDDPLEDHQGDMEIEESEESSSILGTADDFRTSTMIYTLDYPPLPCRPRWRRMRSFIAMWLRFCR